MYVCVCMHALSNRVCVRACMRVRVCCLHVCMCACARVLFQTRMVTSRDRKMKGREQGGKRTKVGVILDLQLTKPRGGAS